MLKKFMCYVRNITAIEFCINNKLHNILYKLSNRDISRHDSRITSSSMFTHELYVYPDFYNTKYHRKLTSYYINGLAFKPRDVTLRHSKIMSNWKFTQQKYIFILPLFHKLIKDLFSYNVFQGIKIP